MRKAVPGWLRRQIMERDKYSCRRCGLAGTSIRAADGSVIYATDLPGVSLCIDHVVPRSLGGDNHPANLRVLCSTCNARKGAKTDEEWVEDDRAALCNASLEAAECGDFVLAAALLPPLAPGSVRSTEVV